MKFISFFSIALSILLFWGEKPSQHCYLAESDFYVDSNFCEIYRDEFPKFNESNYRADILIIKANSGFAPQDYMQRVYENGNQFHYLFRNSIDQLSETILDSIQTDFIRNKLNNINKGKFEAIKENSISGRTMLCFIKIDNKMEFAISFENGSDYDCLSNSDKKNIEKTMELLKAINAYRIN